MTLPTHAARELEAWAKARGWTVSHSRGGHLRWRHRSGALAFTAGTPSDVRAVRNAKAVMRRLEGR